MKATTAMAVSIMATTAGPDSVLWIEMLASLALGVGVVVGLAALASRAASAAQTRRTIWQA